MLLKPVIHEWNGVNEQAKTYRKICVKACFKLNEP